MGTKTRDNKPSIAKAKAQNKSAKTAVNSQNQNQEHNTQKEALGPNTRR
jgi:hypothetical protein